jgi:uroporphyrinogen decarboxylase
MTPAPMTSRERISAALGHREPDRIPFDLGGSRMTGIHVRAYVALREALGLAPGRAAVSDVSQQLADVEPDVLDALGCDVRCVSARSPSTWRRVEARDGDYLTWFDEWGVGRRMPVRGGAYYDTAGTPLGGEIDASAIDRFPWPDAGDPGRTEGMAADAARFAEGERRAVLVGSICAGVTEMLFRLRGFEDGYMDLAAEPALARRLMERVLEVKLGYWARVLPLLAGTVDVVAEADDLGGQARTLFSPAAYRSLVKPLHRELFAFIHANTDARVFFHTCGAVRELIPDLIEVGVDILNPVQVSAAGMDTAGLKRDFGRDLVFWGGGVDTQRVLGSGTPAEVGDEVRRRVADLAPGGGFVFAAVHNVQPNVAAANVLAMHDAVVAAGRGR